MGLFDIFTKELPSSWDEPDVKKWKENAKQLLKSYYLGFGGSQWDCYNDSDRKLLLAKICFAMFGSPSKESNNDLCDAYTDEQKTSASAVMLKILDVYREVPSRELMVGIIFISCKLDENVFALPLFSVFESGDPTNPRAGRRYVDTQKRAYKDWDDWKNNNTLPMLKYAYPRRGFFTSSRLCSYEFDPNGEPDIEFGTSPQCDLSSRFFRQTDTLSAVASLGCGVVGVVSMFTPLAPAVLLASAIGGGGSAVYGTGRAINRLVDKGKHNENMADLESFMLYFSIAATPLNFTTSIVNASLVRGATVNGRIFSESSRMLATIVNFSTLGVDAVLVGFGLVNMIEKMKNDQLTALDVVQFSMSLFFFTNTLIRPQMASKIIKTAQDKHIQAYANSMSDEAARATFNKFVTDNKQSGSIKDTSKIVRTINKIENPDSVFGAFKSSEKIVIGGRKGNTLLVTSNVPGEPGNSATNRINPNKVLFSHEAQNNYKTVNLKMGCFGETKLKDIKVKGKAIFENLTNKEKARVNRVFKESAQNKRDVVTLAIDIAKALECDNLEEVLSVVEIVGADIKKQCKETPVAITNIRQDLDKFIAGIENDLNKATQLAEKQNMNFNDPYKAVYHYRKHGTEFSAKIKHQTIEVYLQELPKKLIKDFNLTEISQNKDGSTTKIYNTVDDKFAAVLENVDIRTIKTMYNNEGSYKNFLARLKEFQDGKSGPNPLDSLPEFIARSMGFRGCHITLVLENGEKLVIK